MDPAYFQRQGQDGVASEVTRHDFSLLCHRFACETYGCPTFGPFDNRTLEFPDGDDATGPRREVLAQVGYHEVQQPPADARDPSPAFAA